jgi:hypothetical protein
MRFADASFFDSFQSSQQKKKIADEDGLVMSGRVATSLLLRIIIQLHVFVSQN